MIKLHWGVAAFDASSKGDGQHNCSTEHGHHSKEPNELILKLTFVGKTFDLPSADFLAGRSGESSV